MRLIDISHTVVDGMTTYPGLPGPVVSDYLSREASRSQYAPGTEFEIRRIEMVANTGTYLDTPSTGTRTDGTLRTSPSSAWPSCRSCSSMPPDR